MSLDTISIESASVEPVDVFLVTEADPTEAPPSFQVTADGVRSPVDGGWVEGEWVGAWSETQIEAQSPSVGGLAAAIPIPSEGNFTLWIRWGTVVKRAAVLHVT